MPTTTTTTAAPTTTTTTAAPTTTTTTAAPTTTTTTAAPTTTTTTAAPTTTTTTAAPTTTTTTAAPGTTTTTTPGPTTTTTTTEAPPVPEDDDGIRYELQILTLMHLVERVTRPIDQTFYEHIGRWARVRSDGSLANIIPFTPSKVNKLVIGSKPYNKYEGHDASVGRITTMESYGIRCKVSATGYDGIINQGDRLVVSVDPDSLGQLISAETNQIDGTYEVVARAEEINTTEGYLIFRTLTPAMVVVH